MRTLTKRNAKQKLHALQLAQVEAILELKKLADKYLIVGGMSPQQVFQAFVDQEENARPEFVRRAQSASTPAKRRYWFERASGLNTEGGKNRLRKLLSLSTLPRKETP